MSLLTLFSHVSTSKEIVRGSVQSDYEQVFKVIAQNRHLPHRLQYCQNLVANFQSKWNIGENTPMIGKLNVILKTFPRL